MSVTARPANEYRSRDRIPARRAIVSLSDKTGLEAFARALAELDVEIVSTGSTAQTIRSFGIEVTDVAAVTGFAEALDGRVKTLHPSVHAGLLADLRLEDHERQLATLDIAPFEIVAVNLYPFAQTVASGADAATTVENIDIGGPAMVRASAKNHPNVAVVVNPADYDLVIAELRAGGTTLATRTELARRAFRHTASYDTAVADWFDATLELNEASSAVGDVSDESPFSETLTLDATLFETLRYGENAHQAAAIYRDGTSGIARATQHGGKAMSFNNYVDTEAAIRAAYDFSQPTVAIIKHANPCGIASAPLELATEYSDAIEAAYQRAFDTDPVSAFGGVVATNRVVTVAMAERLAKVFTEVVIAPGYEPAALALLQEKKNLRILELPDGYRASGREVRQISGGFLVQERDVYPEGTLSDSWQLVTGEAADAQTLADLEFAWRAVRSVKSNAILLARGGAAVGVGMGQVNRVDSCRLAVSRAGDRSRGSVAASDAFFPFADGLEILLDGGVSAIVQPGGSKRDDEVIEAARARGVTMYFTGERHFAH